MKIGVLIKQIAESWPAYLSKGKVDKTDPVYEKVVNDFPQALQPLVEQYTNIEVQGSTGVGNITAAPWIALFDRRLTNSATSGYYIVYLFSVDLSSVTLSLAFGTTQFTKQFGGPTESFPRMRSAATRLQEMFNHLIPASMSRAPIDLSAGIRQRMHYTYQQASILSYAPYPLGALPQEQVLASDLQSLVELYDAIVSDPLEASVDQLVEAVATPAASIELITVCDFEPRPPSNATGSASIDRRARRYSPESRKVGDAGERIVVRHEQERLARIGRQDLADRVRCHAQEKEFLGWDITSFNEDGEEIFIEVKSSIGKRVSCVNLTGNEWDAARKLERQDHYYIYVVTGALSSIPNIERLRNPASYVCEGQLVCSPIAYSLQLRKDDAES
jgi:hypothetical protein